MTAVAPRRAFLRGLVSLPLIGGGVTLIGQPTAVAEPINDNLLEGYKVWLDAERRHLCWMMSGDPEHQFRYRNFPWIDRHTLYQSIEGCRIFVGHRGNAYHDRDDCDRSGTYERAALVMSTVGCEWERTP